MEIKNYKMHMVLLIIILLFSLLVEYTKIYEGARSRYSRGNSNTNTSILYKELEKKVNTNKDEVKKINDRLDSMGDLTKRIQNVERKTKDMP